MVDTCCVCCDWLLFICCCCCDAAAPEVEAPTADDDWIELAGGNSKSQDLIRTLPLSVMICCGCWDQSEKEWKK